MSAYANPHPEPVLIGVIGGSGVYKLNWLQDAKYYNIDTPFGRPSADVCVAKVDGITAAFLPRHGVHHTLTPSEVNYQANICALKQMGVRYIIAINAVGSLDARYRPGDLVLVDQMIDKTMGRKSTFFGNGIVSHVDFAFPTSKKMIEVAHAAMLECFPEVKQGTAGWSIHPSGTLVTMEGPQFSTKAESLSNKQIGGHLIGMTASTEARLAREAEMAYLTVAMVTDMDAWSDEPHVDVSIVMKTVHDNAEKAQLYPPFIIRAVSAAGLDDPAHDSLKYAIVTPPEGVPAETRARLAPLLAKKYPQYAP